MSAKAEAGTLELRSWGRTTRARAHLLAPRFTDQLRPGGPAWEPRPVLAFGMLRSYSDSCLNDGGRMVDMRGLDRVMSFDRKAGIIRAQAGITLDEIARLCVPHGWFLPTTPGTRFVTLGGAIANDVHGKNHHRAGTFGHAVEEISLVRSDADRETLSPRRNPELFAATIGGLGLTGIITEATIRLAPIASAWLDARRTAFHSLEEYFALAERAAAQSEHTVAWIDCLGGGGRGRGIFQQADWCADGALEPHSASGGLTVPFDAPGFALNGMTMRAFNELYFRLQAAGPARQRVHYAPFFYPLDALGHWNRLYGRRGFYQYQCVLPPRAAKEAAGEILSRIARARAGSFLAVIKTFGDVPARGLLSFARPGTTLALDFPNKGPQTLELMNALDAIVRAADGALYPAKDARMPRALFESGYPDADRFKAFVDPAMSSDFWSRVTS